MSGAFSKHPSAAGQCDGTDKSNTAAHAPSKASLRLGVCTCLSQGTRVGGVGVSMLIPEVFGDVVARQLGHYVGDVSIGAEVLQPFVGAPWWRNTRSAG